LSEFLEVIWARTHNLKNINVKIPKNKITVITGLSGSGKSSLAFNTIYSIGQQRYLESLSSYARMFIWWIKEEAEVDEIKGLSPTISIDQKTTSKNPRSTVGTITEIYDYYKLLYLNIGERKCIKCETTVKKDSISDIIDFLNTKKLDTKFFISAPLIWNFNDFDELKNEILSLGFIRFQINKDIYTINDNININNPKNVSIIIDRLTIKNYSDNNSSDTKRLKDSLELAYRIWAGILDINIVWDKKIQKFSKIFICSKCSHVPKELTISSFSFNSHAWACKDCHWLGVKKIFLEEKVINYNLTLLEWAVIAPWFWWDYFFALLKEISKSNNLNLNKNYSLLSEKERKIILYGTGDKKYKINFLNESWIENTYNSRFEWVINTLTRRYFDGWADKWHYDDFVEDMDCITCNWQRLDIESLSVYLNWLNIWDLSDLSIIDALKFLNNISLSPSQKHIASKILKNALERLEFLKWVGLNYMTISRRAATLSWWEAQRIRLATQIWTKLEWIIYVLDEPSIGLHPRDNNMLIDNLKRLRDIWNTLIIVEHDEDIMKNADYIIDIWPWAWIHWWAIVSQGSLKDIINDKNSVTGPFLSWKKDIVIKRDIRKKKEFLKITWAKQNNLQNIDVIIPLSNFVVVTWVSGSWKSSLINDILANYLANKLNRAKKKLWLYEEIKGVEKLDKVVVIDQSPIWKTPRSNPATYTWVMTLIRDVFSMTHEAQIRWYTPGRFSFNTKLWRCQECDWDGVKKIEMHFLAPVYIGCESCMGKRYNPETLQIKYKWKTISDVLNMTVEEALEFFSNHPKVSKILKTLNEVWLGYIKLGQASTTLSWWEAQRIKLSTQLSKRSTTKTFYILDEPTTWLHFQDVNRLLIILHSLVDRWNSVLVIEHNMDVILNADHIIDIWPEWWDKWWKLVACWDIWDIINVNSSYTWKAIIEYQKK